MIGVAISTRNRREVAADTVRRWLERMPEDGYLVVVDDHSDEPFEMDGVTVLRSPFQSGVAASKNTGLRFLDDLGASDFFLADDDTYPTSDEWWKPYVDSPEPHLMYQFPSAPAHWALKETHRDEAHVGYDKARGCMLYVSASVLEAVGGMSYAFGKHGGEHEDWSLRIHEAGLTSHPFLDVVNAPFHCLDEDGIGSSVDWRDHKSWREIDRTNLPSFCGLNDDPYPILVPYRPDGGHRDRLWRFVESDYWEGGVTEGEHLEGPFNRSAAINLAAKKAGNWQAAIIADSDTWVPPNQVEAGIRAAMETGHLVSCLDRVVELDQQTTENILTFGFSAIDTKYAKVRTAEMETQSSMLAVPRHLFERLGGFDERFVSWGGEDNSFWRAAHLIGGPVVRTAGPAYHLWHEPASTREERQKDPQYIANYKLWQRYERARNETEMHEVLKR